MDMFLCLVWGVCSGVGQVHMFVSLCACTHASKMVDKPNCALSLLFFFEGAELQQFKKYIYYI